MAVPPLAAKIIIEAVLKTFAGLNYEYVVPNITLEKTPLQEKLPQFQSFLQL